MAVWWKAAGALFTGFYSKLTSAASLSQDGIGSPVTDAECALGGAGRVYNTANAANSCAGATCDVGSSGAIDQGVCCRS